MPTDAPTRLAVVTGERAPDLSEDGRAVAAALAARGFRVEPVCWTDRSVDWADYDAALVRSCWEYHTDLPRFRALLAAMEDAGVAVCNPLPVIRWNLHKSYLVALADAGVPVPPTTVVERGTDAGLSATVRRHGWTEAVVKPAVGTSSTDVWRVSPEEARRHEDRFDALCDEGDVLVQAFVPEIRAGERSMVFFRETYSHAWNSRTAADDVTAFDGVDLDYEPTRRQIARGRRIVRTARDLAGIDDPIPYARLDYVTRGDDLRVMELELIEPYLGLDRGEGAVETFCDAITASLRGD